MSVKEVCILKLWASLCPRQHLHSHCCEKFVYHNNKILLRPTGMKILWWMGK